MMFSRFGRNLTCDKWTVRRTQDKSIYCTSTASRSENQRTPLKTLPYLITSRYNAEPVNSVTIMTTIHCRK